MKLTRHNTPQGPRWAADDHWLKGDFSLHILLSERRAEMIRCLDQMLTTELAHGELLAPIEADQEVWAGGVTYLRSREARQAESAVGDVYDRVYAARRPELFFKALGWRVAGHGQPVRCRADSDWNVPEPELTLIINRFGEIIGYTAGNDMSSRSIEGENPLYLPQAKVYTGACSLGQAIHLEVERLNDLPIELTIERGGRTLFQGSTRTTQMHRKFEELVLYLFRELSFPAGVFLLTGTGIVPPEQFTLASGDRVTVAVGEATLTNEVAS